MLWFCVFCVCVLQEMTDIVRAIYDMMGKYTYPALKTDTPKQHVDAFFQKMDKNRDGVVTLDEFILSCQEVNFLYIYTIITVPPTYSCLIL